MTIPHDYQRSRTNNADYNRWLLAQDCARYADIPVGDIVDIKTVAVTQVTTRDPEHPDMLTEFTLRHYLLDNAPDLVTEEGMLGRAHDHAKKTLLDP